MKITFLGAAHEVTGSCTLLEVSGKKLLIDCGMEQGPDIYENSGIPYPPADIDYVFLTHAHIDHSGKLPLLTKNGFRGKVFSTRATRDLCAIMLEDSAHIQETEAVWKNRRAKRSGEGGYTPMYTTEDVYALMKQFSPADYGDTVSPADGIIAVFFDAGHLLGSAGIKLTLTEGDVTKTVIFSGDIGTKGRPLLCDPVYPDAADAVIIESTYGDREREPVPTDYEARIAEIIDETLAKGGNVVVPSFAVGRTQELLYMIRRIKEKHLTKQDFPVWLDSPLAIEATNIYGKALRVYYDDETRALIDRGINPISFPNLRISVSGDESRLINTDPTPKVIISASGMCEAGRIRHHLKYNLWRPESTVLFVGYQVEGTLGRRLLDGADYVNLFGEEIRVRARIVNLSWLSGHSDRDMLLDWLGSMQKKPAHVYVNHGADGVCDSFAEAVRDKLGLDAAAPYSGDSFDLATGARIAEGRRTKIKREKADRQRAHSAVWSRLYAAGMRLMGIIEKSRGGKSRALIAFTDRINTLCDRQEKELRKK